MKKTSLAAACSLRAIKRTLVSAGTVAGMTIALPVAGAGYSGEGLLNARVTVGGEGATPSITIVENNGLTPNTKSGTTVLIFTTQIGGTRQGVKIDSVCPIAGCVVKASWSLLLSAPDTTTDIDGYTYAETGPTTYKALLQSTGPIEPGTYTVKVETLWIY